MKLKTQNFYNTFSVFYPLVDLFLKPQKRKLLEEINKENAGLILDVGVGNGTHLPLYKNHSVVGIDSSISMLNYAKKYQQNHQLIQMNAENLDFENEKFDYIVLSHVLAVVEDPNLVLKEVNRVLKKGGKIFILNHFTPKNGLGKIDYLLQPFSKFLHLKSVFLPENLVELQHFSLEKEENLGWFSYFKLLVYCKK